MTTLYHRNIVLLLLRIILSIYIYIRMAHETTIENKYYTNICLAERRRILFFFRRMRVPVLVCAAHRSSYRVKNRVMIFLTKKPHTHNSVASLIIIIQIRTHNIIRHTYYSSVVYCNNNNNITVCVCIIMSRR